MNELFGGDLFVEARQLGLEVRGRDLLEGFVLEILRGRDGGFVERRLGSDEGCHDFGGGWHSHRDGRCRDGGGGDAGCGFGRFFLEQLAAAQRDRGAQEQSREEDALVHLAAPAATGRAPLRSAFMASALRVSSLVIKTSTAVTVLASLALLASARMRCRY